jgi:hypothetical protein
MTGRYGAHELETYEKWKYPRKNEEEGKNKTHWIDSQNSDMRLHGVFLSEVQDTSSWYGTS